LSGHPPPLHEKIVARDHVVRSGLTSFRSSADVLRCLAIPGRYTRIGSLRTTLSVAGLLSDDLHLEAFRVRIREQAPEAEQAAMTIAEQMRREGLERGLEQGREEGREEGHREGSVAMLTKLLTLKFGDLSLAHPSLIAEASPEQLECYVERVLTTKSIDEVFESSSASS